jgi:malonyl-CoA/methylmalonyl-CoA synthetase
MPFPGVELRLDPETSGIEVRGPNVFAGYLDRPDATAEAFTEDGWFRTGDVGALDDDGYLSIVGRAKELIISGGYNVYPREIEDVLRMHPSVTDAAVVGTPDDEWGEVVTAYVEADDSFDAGALVSFAAEQLAPYKRPRIVHRIDALPRNPLGKVQRDRINP